MVVTDTEHGHPIFGKVDKIMVVNGSMIIFKYKTLHVIQYDAHLNAYNVHEEEDEDEVNLIIQEHLVDFHPLGLHKGFGCNSDKKLVVLRYRIDCMQ